MSLSTTFEQTAAQRHHMAGLFAAARGTIALDTSGHKPIRDEHLKATAAARDGLAALTAQHQLQPGAKAVGKPEASMPHVGKGLGTIGRGVVGIGADVIGHTLANAFAGPVGGIIYTGFALGRMGQAAVKSAGATPTISPPPTISQERAGYETSASDRAGGKGSMVMGGGKSRGSFAAKTDHDRGVTTTQHRANAIPAPKRRFNYAEPHSNWSGVHKKQMEAAHAMKRHVDQQSGAIGELLQKPKMDAFAPGVRSSQRIEHTSFAEEVDLYLNKGGKMRLGETGQVSREGLDRFAERHHQPTPPQQRALQGNFGTLAPAMH